MPIYEYKCNNCDHVFEELVSSEPQKPFPCPKCASDNIEKIMSAAAVGKSTGSAEVPSCASTCSLSNPCCGSGSCPM